MYFIFSVRECNQLINCIVDKQSTDQFTLTYNKGGIRNLLEVIAPEQLTICDNTKED